MKVNEHGTSSNVLGVSEECSVFLSIPWDLFPIGLTRFQSLSPFGLTKLALTIEPVSHRINQVYPYHGSLTEGRILVSEMKTVIKVHHLIEVLR